MTKLDALIAAEQAAETAYSEARAACKSETNVAIAEIGRKHEPAITAARKAYDSAFSAARDARSAAAAHPWESRKVFKTEKIYGRWSNQPNGEKRKDGVVEVCRIGTNFAANLSGYSTPKIGEAFVRLLKKDGKPGVAIQRGVDRWALVDGEFVA